MRHSTQLAKHNRNEILNRAKILPTDQQRKLYELCWQFEDSWTRGERILPEDWLSKASDIPKEIVLAELTETQRELEAIQSKSPNPAVPIVDERYEFIEEIARGGAAVVWRVCDRHLGRETAVKYLLDSQDNREMRARLEKEARLCARLVHPGIVPIHELSSFADQRPFVSMKLVEGKTLLQLLESNPPPSLKSTIEIFTKACQAMAYAHSKGIIHRDLKPGNIMVGSFGEVQIMDWGLAKDLSEKIAAQSKSNHPTSFDQSVFSSTTNSYADTKADELQNETTIVGSVFGTIAYMSPEQANGQINCIDKRSDVFSLGALLCRLLTGLSPYQQSDKPLPQDAMLARAQKGDLKPAFERLARVRPHKLGALANRCMANDPNARPADAEELVKLLEEARLSDQRTRHALRFVTVGVGVILLIAGSILWSRRSEDSATQLESGVVPLPMVALDSATAKELLKSNQKQVVLDNYRNILDKSPNDEDLHTLVEMALLNTQRWTDSEQVAHDLIKLNPGNPDYHFLLSESLFWQGKYEPAKTVMLHSKGLRDGGVKAQFSIDKSLARLEKYMRILEQVSLQPPPTFESLSSEELLEVGEACGLVGKIKLAIDYYQRGLSKQADTFRRSIARYHVLRKFVGRNLLLTDLSDDSRNALNAVCLEWMQEQFDCVPISLRPPYSTTELIKILKGPEFDFTRKMVDDTRVAPGIRDGLKKLLEKIDQASMDLLDQ